MLPYLCAHFAKSQLWHASGLLFAFFLTEACGLTPQAMGWVLGLTLMLNGLVDLILGARLNDRIADAATAARWQARAAPAVAVCFLLFAITPWMPEKGRLVWALAALGGFRLLYPLVDVAQNALVPMMTNDAAVQRRWLAARNIASSLAALAVAALAAPLLLKGHGATIYPLWATLVAGGMWWSSDRIARSGWSSEPMPSAPSFEETGGGGFPVLLLALAVMVFAGTVFCTMEPYFAAFASHRPVLMLWAAIGAPIGQPLWLRWIGRHGMRWTLLGIATMLMLAAWLLTGSIRGSAVGGAVIGLVFGAGTSGLWLVLWAMMIRRATGGRAMRHVGAFTCVSKLAQGAATLLVGRILSLTSYSQTLADPASPPSRSMVAALVVTAGVAVALAACRRGVGRTGRGGTAASPPGAVRSAPPHDRPRAIG